MKSKKLVKVKITKTNIDFYKERGYEVGIGEIHNIKSLHVRETVATKIYVICQNCGIERYIHSYNYHNQIKKSGYYVCKSCKQTKAEQTNRERYGCISPLQNKEISEKAKSTLIRLYGVDNISKLEEVKKSRSENFKNKDFKEKAKNTWLEKWGVDNPSKSDIIKEKKVKTYQINWGVDNPTQSSEIFEKSQKSGKKIKQHISGIYYRGTYELDFLNFCHEMGVEVKKGPRIEYLQNDKKRYYHSDFYIEKLDLICEIKSSYYYNKYLDLNKLKEKYSKKEHNFLFIIDKNYYDIEILLKS